MPEQDWHPSQNLASICDSPMVSKVAATLPDRILDLRNIRQNLAFAFLYNVLGVPIAAGVLYPVAGLLLSPMLAGVAMSLSSVSVIGNALRLRAVDLDRI